jgi:hypothetical protein
LGDRDDPTGVRMLQKLHAILSEVRRQAEDSFTGVGVIVCDAPDQLPILPLRPSAMLSDYDLIHTLASISVADSDYHDGFHILSSDWRLLRVSQYFSPPILTGVRIEHRQHIGGRYMAALFGSALPGVWLTGIASRGVGIVIFRDGAECLEETRQ